LNTFEVFLVKVLESYFSELGAIKCHDGDPVIIREISLISRENE
jgi:hypothetical protein